VLLKKLSALLSVSIIILFSFSGCGLYDTSSSETLTSDGKPVKADKDDNSWQKNIGKITLGDTPAVTGQGISVKDNIILISQGGDFEVSGTLTNGMIHVYTGEKVRLTLNNAHITNENGPAIFFERSKRSFISTKKDTVNSLTDGTTYSYDAKATLFSNDTLEFQGSGTLEVTGNFKHAIASDDDILADSGAIIIKSAKTDGFHANDNITVNNAEIDVAALDDGMNSEGDILIGGGKLTVSAGDDGIHAATVLKITAGEINIKKSFEGLEGKASLHIDGGTLDIHAEDDALNAGVDLVINNGTIFADCNGDGIDSNGSITINGGTSVVYSGNNANGPLDTGKTDGRFTVNGGTILALGGKDTIKTDDNSKQYSMWIKTAFSENNIISIFEDQKEILSFKPIKSAALAFLSLDKLKKNNNYIIYSGGTHSGTLANSVFGKGDYTKGTELGKVVMSEKTVTIGS